MRGMQNDPTKLKLSFDRKVSNEGWWYEQHQFWVATIPNSFGLPAGDSCPGRTEFCNGCYAINSEIRNKAVRRVVEHNLNLLKAAGTIGAMAELLTEMVGRFRRYADRRKITGDKRIFRIHWDGDFFSVDYAVAWYRTIALFPDVKFWCYTRSFVAPVNVVPFFMDRPLPNLAFYLSIDQWNADAALKLAEQYPVLLAGCAEDYRRARALVGGRPSLICPENGGKVPLNEGGVGACVSCMLCPEGKRDVLFSTSHKENEEVQLTLGPTPAGKCACGCGVSLPVSSGRPRKWATEQCRWKVYNQRRAKGEVK